MDSKLIEKVTKLVILKLEELSISEHHVNDELKNWNRISSSDATIPTLKDHNEIIPLSNEEVNKWKVISSSIWVARKPLTDGNGGYTPLNEEELNKWDKLNTFAETRNKNDIFQTDGYEKGKVKFSKFF